MSLHHGEEQLAQLRKWLRTILQLRGHCFPPHFPICLPPPSMPHSPLSSHLPQTQRHRPLSRHEAHNAQKEETRVESVLMELRCRRCSLNTRNANEHKNGRVPSTPSLLFDCLRVGVVSNPGLAGPQLLGVGPGWLFNTKEASHLNP